MSERILDIQNLRKHFGRLEVLNDVNFGLAAGEVVPEFAPQIRAVILCGTLIYELVGPAITKLSLKKAGEIQGK